ncbi:MAG TPA: hypothetical protein V6D19_07860 [Stenomitos sp.]
MKIKRFKPLLTLIGGLICLLFILFLANTTPTPAQTSCTTGSLAGTYRGQFARVSGPSCPSRGGFTLVIERGCTFTSTATVSGKTVKASGIICSNGKLAGKYTGLTGNAGFVSGQAASNKGSGTFGDGLCRFSFSGTK